MAIQSGKTNAVPAINRQTWKQRMRSYRRTPLSFVLFLLVCLSAVVTVGILAMLIGYILVKGIPNLTPTLFAWKYNTENVSMLPALINTILMVLREGYTHDEVALSLSGIFKGIGGKRIN